MQKLKKWHRLGIVLSIVWLLYSIVKSRNAEIESAKKFNQLTFDLCNESHPIAFCVDQNSKNYELLLKPNWIDILMSAFIPLIATWLVIYLFLYTYKWIMKGK